MHDFVILCRVQLLGLLNSLAPGHRNRGKRTTEGRIALAALGYVVLAALCVGYLFMMGCGLVALGLANAIPVFAVLAGALGGVGFAFAKTRGTLFELTDFDHVMALPVPRRTVVASRLASLYLASVATSILLAGPLYAAYFLETEVTVPGVVCAAVTVVLAPAIPVSIAVFASFGLTALAARFRHANSAYIVLTLALITALVVGIYGFSFAMPRQDDAAAMAMVTSLASTASSGIATFWPPANWAASTVTSGSVVSLLLFVGLSLAIPALTLEVIQRNYLALNGMLVARTGRRSGPTQRTRAGQAARTDAAASVSMRSRTPFQALLRKEFATMVGVPAYAINCLFGYVFLIVIAIALSVVGLRDLLLSGVIDGVDLSEQDVDAALGQIMLIVPWMFAFFATMSPTAACSVSMEGRGAWIMETLPIPPRTVLGAKLAANAIPVAAVLALCAGVLLGTGQIAPVTALEILVVGFGGFYLVTCIALHLDARNPNLDWSSPNEVVKRGLPVMVCVFGGMAIGFGGGAGTMLLSAVTEVTVGHAATLAFGTVAIVAGQLIFEHTCRTATLQY